MIADLRRALGSIAPLGVLLILLTVLRALFFIANHSAFVTPPVGQGFMIALQGLRFDTMTVVIANALWILLTLLPLPWRDRNGWRNAMRALFIAANVCVLFLCCVDLAYFGFNGKRLSRDILGQTGVGLRELPGMALRYWWVTLVFIASIWIVVRATRNTEIDATAAWWKRAIVFVVLAGLLLLVGRGGWQYQGLSPAHAAQHIDPRWAPLVTNSAFTFGYSLTEDPLPQHDWFTAEELDRLVPLRYELPPDSSRARPNVVLLIVESLAKEYIGALNNGSGYTPFLDSLCARSLVFTNAYANAERSNKSMCALLAGIPSFTDDAFMNTAFAGNTVEGLGTRLKQLGYSRAFMHGGLNGEYKLDAFSAACGFDRYFGRDEFGDDRFFDGHWGVYDEEFLGYAADRIGEMPQPFCAVEFTLSSHDPFLIPDRYKGIFPKGTQEIHEAMGYTDMSLRTFFKKVEKEAWAANTVFVITGDHTFQYNQHPPEYSNPAGRFAVPIILYKTDGSFHGTDGTIAQHLDLLPTILDLVGYSGPVNTFGRSLLRNDRTPRAVIQLGGQFRLIQDDRLLLFDGERAIGLYDFHRDTLCTNDLHSSEPDLAARLTTDLKAMIQRHGEVLLRNAMVAR